MAIKGKTRKKGKARGGAGAPRPIIIERKPPMLARRGVRRGIVIGLVLVAVLGGLRVWQNVSRSSALKKYERSLGRTQGLMTAHFAEGALTNFAKSATDFGAGKLDGKRFQDLSKLWEKDFSEVRTSVAKLKPPKAAKPAKDAQDLILRGIDGYVGVARLYFVAGTQRLNADSLKALAAKEKDPAAKKPIEAEAKKAEDLIQVLLQHAAEARDRADQIYGMGTALLIKLNQEWNLEGPPASQPGQFPPGQDPDEEVGVQTPQPLG